MAEKFEVLTDREHTLLKAHIMVGSLAEEDYSTYINGTYRTLKVVPGLLVIVREIIDNCVDEFIRSGKKSATKIKIDVNYMSLTVEDNGRGIPIQKYKNKDIDEWQPVLCWTQLRAGTSFTGHDIGPSSNGVGSSVANILSDVFIGETWDGKNYCKVSCSDNMNHINVSIQENKKHTTGTKVYIEPSFERFGVSGFSPDHILAIKERIIALSSVYSEITFIFNSEKIRTKKPKEYLSIYNKPYVLHSSENYFFAIMPTELDEYYQQTYIDGLYVKNGGSHEAYLSREISYTLKDMIKKKYKIELSPSEIKRGLFLCCSGRFFPSLKFDSQTKDRLTNSESEVKAYFGDIPFESICRDIMNTPDIIEPIIEAKLAKQIAAEKRAITLEQKKMSRRYVEKHIPARGKKDTVLALCEGDSAQGMMLKVRDINRHGSYPMRGCLKNVYGAKDKEILENKELNDIMTILGLRFNMTAKEIANELTYDKIGIFCDQDIDGRGHIATLAINFFARWPELFNQRRVYIITSPLYIFTKDKGKRTEKRVYCYTKAEYENVRDKYKDWEMRYIKGLGSLRPKEYRDVLDSTEKWLCVELDNPECLDIMFSPDVNKRRQIMGI